MVSGSPLFDESFYLELYPDVAAYPGSPAEHYLRFGGPEGRFPHPLFDGAHYLARNGDIAANGDNPLHHFLTDGAREGRDPNPLFDTAWYADHYLGGDATAENPLEHYLRHPMNATSRLFESEWYAANYMRPEERGGNPLVHYLRVGRDKGFLPNSSGEPDFANRSYRLLPARLFDGEFYFKTYADLVGTGVHPFVHYMLDGAREGRHPSPLFDPAVYAEQIPDLHEKKINPLVHYLETGAGQGLNPNHLFHTAWYRETYPESVADGATPLTHFIDTGGRISNPSPLFDAPWYLARHVDVDKAGLNPLAHYLWTGRQEGREVRTVTDAGRPEEDPASAALSCLKNAERSAKRTVLLVTHSGTGLLKRHVRQLVEGYRRQACDVVLIVATDRRRTLVPDEVFAACAAVYVRGNRGFDFAAWAHVLRHDETLLDAECLILTNDSLVGPLDEESFRAMLERVDRSSADIVGLTDNTYFTTHLQSFFLALKKDCLSSYGFVAYLNGIRQLENKNDVIRQYELTFSPRMRILGMTQELLFPRKAGQPEGWNRTIFDWQALLDEGFPFVKASLLIGEHKKFGGEPVRQALEARGFDLASLRPETRPDRPGRWADLDAPSPPAGRSRIAFFGPVNIANGLGMASRGYVKALHRAPWSVNLHPLERPFHVHRRLAPGWQCRSFSGDADVALVHLNGDSWEHLLGAGQRWCVARARKRVGLFVWETSFVPRTWFATLDALDAIWVPTAFCADIFRAMTPVSVEVVPYVVENEPPPPVDAEQRARTCAAYGLDAAKRHILYAFDGSSYLVRKNPHALIRAFRASGLDRAGWQLVLKTKHIFDVPLEGDRLMKLVGGAGDVVLIDRPMAATYLATLFGLCDIYASPHSSEGFGLTIAEAMEAGKVVVATDYGGSRDFLDASCGFPVRAEEVELTETHGPYLEGAVWGRVDEKALAEALGAAARAVEDGTAVAIGRAAHARIRERLSIAAVSEAMTRSLDRLLGRTSS